MTWHTVKTSHAVEVLQTEFDNNLQRVFMLPEAEGRHEVTDKHSSSGQAKHQQQGYLGASRLAEATVFGGKDSSSAARSTLPALGSEKILTAGDGMLMSFASPFFPRDNRPSIGAAASPDGKDCRPEACVRVTPALTAHWWMTAGRNIFSLFHDAKTFSTWACSHQSSVKQGALMQCCPPRV